MSFKKDAAPLFDRHRTVAQASEIGTFIADLTIVVPTATAFGKTDKEHSLMAGKKEVGKVMLQMGVYDDFDQDLFVSKNQVKEVKKEFAVQEDTLNFELMTRGGMIWDKKWIVTNSSGIEVFSDKYRTAKRSLLFIPYEQMKAVRKAGREKNMAYGLVIEVKLPWSEGSSSDEGVWKDLVVEAGSVVNGSLELLLAADSMERMERWLAFLTYSVNRFNL